MKNKKYILIFVFALLAIIYIIRAFASGRVVKETLYRDYIEDSISTKGMMIKYESLYSPDIDGMLDAKFTSGERVATGSQIAVVYKGTVDANVKNRLEQVNKKIAVLEKSYTENESFSNDISKLEQEITSYLEEIISLGYDKDMSGVASLKYNITALAEHKATIEGNTPAKTSTLDQLKQTKAELEAQIGAAESSIYAQSPGIFSSYIDGLEQLITPYNMHELTPAKFDELYSFDENNIKSNENNDNIYSCKVIDNYRYFIAFNIDEDKLAGIEAGDKAKIRFYDISTNATEVEVFHVSPVEEGRAVVIAECHNFHEGLLEKRFVNIDFIKETYSGYKASLSALRTKENKNGLYVLRENILTFVPVNILYNMDDVLIVDSADEKNPLKLYDEVVISAPNYEEGQMID